MLGRDHAVRGLRRIAALGRAAGDEADDERPYRCLTCGTGYELQHHVCPECGGFHVDPDRRDGTSEE